MIAFGVGSSKTNAAVKPGGVAIGSAISARRGASPPRARLPANDFDVLVKCCQQAPEALDGKAGELVVTKCRDLGLRDAQQPRDRGRRESAAYEELIQRVGQTQLGLTFGSVRKPKVSKHVSSAMSDRLSRFS